MVIFDSPPLLLTSEAPVLASLMGQIVVVVCAGVTPQHAVLEAVENLDPEKAISLVLNKSGKGLGNNGYGGYGYGGQGDTDV
jgi:Mrp family chromosome partitioning ATPase